MAGMNSWPNRWIALHGGPFAGKTTFTSYLVTKKLWTPINSSFRLKQIASRMLSVAGLMEVTPREMEENKAFWRSFLQEFGTVLGIDDGEKFYYHFVETAVTLPNPSRYIVVDTVRLPDQARVMRTKGFSSVRINVSDATRWARAQELGVSRSDYKRTMAHPVEQSLPVELTDFEINGEQDVEDMYDELMSLLNEWGTRGPRSQRVET